MNDIQNYGITNHSIGFRGTLSAPLRNKKEVIKVLSSYENYLSSPFYQNTRKHGVFPLGKIRSEMKRARRELALFEKMIFNHTKPD